MYALYATLYSTYYIVQRSDTLPFHIKDIEIIFLYPYLKKVSEIGVGDLLPRICADSTQKADTSKLQFKLQK